MKLLHLALAIGVLTAHPSSQVVRKPVVPVIPFVPSEWDRQSAQEAPLEVAIHGMEVQFDELRGSFGKPGDGLVRLNNAIKKFRVGKSAVSLANVLAERTLAYYGDPKFDKSVPLPEDVMQYLEQSSRGPSKSLAFLTYTSLGSDVFTPKVSMRLDASRERLLKSWPQSNLCKAIFVQRLEDHPTPDRKRTAAQYANDIEKAYGDCYLSRLMRSWIATEDAVANQKSRAKVAEVLRSLGRLKEFAPRDRLSKIEFSLRLWRTVLKSISSKS